MKCGGDGIWGGPVGPVGILQIVMKSAAVHGSELQCTYLH